MLMQACPAARDDALFSQAVVASCAYWALTMYAWNPVADLLAQDQDWGIATTRQRVLVRSDIFAQTAEQFGHLEALGATVQAMATKLRSRLPAELDALPFFPAFRQQ